VRRQRPNGSTNAPSSDLARLVQAETELEARVAAARRDAAALVQAARDAAAAGAAALDAELAALPPVEDEANRQSVAQAAEVRAAALGDAATFAVPDARIQELAADVIRQLLSEAGT
jgi:hypothetical protein